MSDEGRTALAYSIFKSFKLYKERFDSRLTIAPVESKKEQKEVTKAATSEPQPANVKKETSTQQIEKKTIKNSDAVKKEVKPQVKEVSVVSFAIQIAAYPKKLPLNSKIFKGLENIIEIKIGVYYKYYCLETKSIEKTRQNLATVKSKIPDAFIVAFKNGQPIPIKEALNGR
jgi:N-acetylmuramoyl-L-alanine amidase